MTYRCSDPNHIHSGLVSLHEIEDAAFAAGLDCPLLDTREAKRVAVIVNRDMKLPSVQTVVAPIDALGRYQPSMFGRPAQILIDARRGNYKTLAHELAHHAIAIIDETENHRSARIAGKPYKRLPPHGAAFKRRFREMIPLVKAAAGI